MINSALAYARRGWRVIPLHGVDRSGACTCRRGARCPSAGKHPINPSWQNTPPLSPADIYDAWGSHPGANVGVATGAPSGFFVLDIDPDGGGFETMQALVAQHGPMPATAVQRTGSGGYHYLFALPSFPVRNKQGGTKRWAFAGLDVRGDGGQIVIAPSVSGKGAYALDDKPLAQAPEWLLRAIWEAQQTPEAPTAAPAAPSAPVALDAAEAARLASYAQRAIELELGRLAECRAKATTTGAYDGPPWNHTTYAVACNLTELANTPWAPLTHEQVEMLLLEHAPRDPGFGDYEVRKCLASARQTVGAGARSAPPKPVDLLAPFAEGGTVAAPAPTNEVGRVVQRRTWDDLGNAMRVVDHYGDRIRWVAKNRYWAAYDGRRWVHDADEAVIALIQGMIARLDDVEGELYSDSPVIDDSGKEKPSERKQFRAWAAKQRMAARVDACLKMARARPELQVSPAGFDADPMLLNCTNGVLDLRTATLRPHDPSLMLSMIANVAYDPAARAPNWEAFMARTMPDPSQRAYLQRISGYSITGDTGEQAFFIHQGSGANGKSQYLVVMNELLGEYNQIVPRDTLLVKSGSQIPTDIARMVGKRFLQTSETAAGRRLDEEIVKNLTGGEGVVARHLYGKEFEHTPTGKVHYVTNHLPRLSNADSIWRRLHLLTWGVTIPEGERVKNLGRLLASHEGPGILNWLVQGALAWQELGGLARPEQATADVLQYRTEQDELGEFLEDFIVPAAGARATVETIYTAYQRWIGVSGLGHKALSRQALSMAMRERGYLPFRGTGGVRGFTGVMVRASEPIPFDPMA